MSDEAKLKRKKIIEKVRALLAMTADRGASEAEAMMAAGKASELMEEYDLSYDDVQAELRDEKYGIRAKEFASGADTLHEINFASHAIARYFDCRSWLDTKKDGTIMLVFFGGLDDTAMAFDMILMLKSASEAAYKAFLRSDDADPRVSANKLRKGFLHGFVDRVSDRLDALKHARTKGSEKGTALVLAKDVIVKKKLETWKEETGVTFEFKEHASIKIDDGAYRAGTEAGEKVQLNRALGAEKPR
jgi:hypothetical protein